MLLWNFYFKAICKHKFINRIQGSKQILYAVLAYTLLHLLVLEWLNMPLIPDLFSFPVLFILGVEPVRFEAIRVSKHIRLLVILVPLWQADVSAVWAVQFIPQPKLPLSKIRSFFLLN